MQQLNRKYDKKNSKNLTHIYAFRSYELQDMVCQKLYEYQLTFLQVKKIRNTVFQDPL